MLRKGLNEIFTPNVISVSPTTPVSQAIQIMRKKNISCIVIIEENKPIGIFTERNVVWFTAQRGAEFHDCEVRELMSSPVLTANQNIDLYRAFNLLETNKIRHLVFVDDENRAVGVVTLSNMIKHLGYEYFVELKKVSQIMTKNLSTISKDITVYQAMTKMARNSISCLIVAQDDRPLGILTERDVGKLLIDYSDISQVKVEEVMSSPVQTTSRDTPVHKAVKIMQQEKIRRLVVIDKDGNIVGLTTQFDILKGLEAKYIQTLKQIIKEKDVKIERTLRDLAEKTVYLDNILRSSIYMGIIATDLNFRICYYNPRAEGILGYPAEEVIGRDAREIHFQNNVGLPRFDRIIETIPKNKSHTFTFEQDNKDGKRFIHARASGIWDEEQKLVGFVLMLNDITERKCAEEALQKSEAHIQLIVNNLPYMIFQIDKGLKILWANKMAREMNPDAVGQPCYKAFVCRDIPCEGCDSLAAISKGQIVTCTMHHPKFEGIQGESYWEKTAVPLRNDQGEVTGAIEISSNITERKLMEEERKILEVQLQEARKMEAIATLAGGIAHEFNNALVGVSGNIELLQMDLPNGENIDEYIERTKDSTHRMVRLTNQLLAYARGGKYLPKIISLNDIVEDTVPLLQHNIDSAIRVETDLPGDISHVEADLTQIQMVLSVVLNNAAEAIEGEGRIRIITRDEKIDKEFVETRPYFKPGHYVCLTIEDEGKGMDEETRSRVFEPFFTTKFQGRGLGMAAAYGIIKNHGGSILVDSELGKGTAVRIYLPAVEVRVEQAKKAIIEMAATTGTILVIEDEDVVIDVIGPMLERLGYSMLVAKTGKEAVDIAKTFDGDIDLVLLDIVLPDMRGKDVFSLIIGARSSLKVIVCSGYSVEGPAQEILDAGAQEFIQKPFSFEALSEKLKEVLRGK